MVFGNAAEYRALYPKLPAAQTTIEGFRDHPVRHSVQYSLLTDGEQGLAAHVELDFAHAPGCVVPEAAIVNTSGAGDTAAGVFVAGILDGRRPADVLALCAEAAARVITVPESRIVR
jgi:sugar/nucleoside kinase (ribokinase family)